MLPLGHIAGGFLVTKGFLKISLRNLTETEKRKLVWWSILLAFLPDLDTFYSFYKSASFIVNQSIANHRTYLTHTPLLWFIAGLLIFFVATKPYFKAFGLVVWLAAWSHFLLDSIEYGVRWLWPFSNRLFALTPGLETSKIIGSSFMGYWLNFLSAYSHSVTFYFEVLVIIIAIIVFIKSYILNPKSPAFAKATAGK